MSEKVFVVNGHYEIDPSRMQKYVKQQIMNEAERKRIIDCRIMYLDWMHDHFGESIPTPPTKE